MHGQSGPVWASAREDTGGSLAERSSCFFNPGFWGPDRRREACTGQHKNIKIAVGYFLNHLFVPLWPLRVWDKSGAH